MPRLSIDGMEIDVPAGTTILEAAKSAGLHIPHLCYHPALKIVASCRLCLVEVERMPKLQTACSTEVREGMIVHTNSPKVEKARRGVLEFLLINHPLDCPICDQSGECDLQDYTFTYGSASSRFVEEKRRYPRQDIGPKLVRDMNRCVHCTRCVRFSRDIIGVEEYGVFERGAKTTVGTYVDRNLENMYQGSLMEICPVGALTSRDFRFKVRSWHLSSVPSVCPGCSRGCNIFIDFRGKTVYRLKARQNDSVNSRWMCDEGREVFHSVHSSDRIFRPLQRVEGRLIPCGLDDALGSICDRLQRILSGAGPASIGGIGSSSCTNEENYLLAKLFREVIASPHVDVLPAGRGDGYSDHFLIQADKSPNSRGAEELGCWGTNSGMKSQEMVAAASTGKLKALFVMGQDLVSRLSGDEQIRESLGHLELLVVQDSHENETTKIAHYVLPKATFAEMDGTFTNFEGRVQRIRPAFEYDEVWPGWRTVSVLAEKMGHDWGYSSAENVFAEMARNIPAYAGLTYEKIGETGVKIEEAKSNK